MDTPGFSLAKPELQALYGRVGGELGLDRILKDFYGRMAKDILIGFFFTDKNTDEIAATQKMFLMRAMGISPSYSGKPPAKAHALLPPILSGHFDRRLKILEETLKAHQVCAEDIRTWVAFENAFRDGIVSK